MSDKKPTFAQYKKDTFSLMEDLKYKMMIPNWTINICFSKEKIEPKKGFSIDGSCLVQVDYYTADVTLYPLNFEAYKNDKYEWKHTIIHEMAHILVEPLHERVHSLLAPIEHEYINTLKEQLVETIANIVHSNNK